MELLTGKKQNKDWLDMLLNIDKVDYVSTQLRHNKP